MLDNIISKVILGWIRHAITAFGAGLVTHGYLTTDQDQQAIGALMTLVPILFSAYDKWHAAASKQAALLQQAEALQSPQTASQNPAGSLAGTQQGTAL